MYHPFVEEPCCRYIQAQNKGRAQGHVLPLLPLKGVGTLSKTKQKKRKKMNRRKRKMKERRKKGE